MGAENAPDQSALNLPKSLTRRFEVVIIPESHERHRKLREVKAEGLQLHRVFLRFGNKHLTIPHYIMADIGHLVVVKGMVTRASDVKPHISVCTYTCDVCGAEIYQEVQLALITSIVCLMFLPPKS